MRLATLPVLVGALAALAPAGANGASATRTQTYSPFDSSGQFTLRPELRITESVGGECEMGSFFSATGYRCFGGPSRNGNNIFDPCFAQGDPATGDVQALICPTRVTSNTVTEVQTGESLTPIRRPVRRTPWSVTVGGGRTCSIFGGASALWRGQRINYACSGKGRRFLVGLPSTATKRWTITMVTGADGRRGRRVAIVNAWY
ncbi:unannotated protein [freshwater metagenome]|uniref:Unannotated protein n=1 Tax=freshwater metagenome TaxID=449393 RepID=A0A6J7FYG8_9ZZZZ|nr:hypothetical protein [Actinomycetota bacterium]